MGEQQVLFAVFGDHVVGPRIDEPCAFPRITTHASGLVGGDAYSRAADLRYVLDFDVAVAETEQLIARDGGILKDLLDQLLLGEILVVVDSPEDTVPEK